MAKVNCTGLIEMAIDDNNLTDINKLIYYTFITISHKHLMKLCLNEYWNKYCAQLDNTFWQVKFKQEKLITNKPVNYSWKQWYYISHLSDLSYQTLERVLVQQTLSFEDLPPDFIISILLSDYNDSYKKIVELLILEGLTVDDYIVEKILYQTVVLDKIQFLVEKGIINKENVIYTDDMTYPIYKFLINKFPNMYIPHNQIHNIDVIDDLFNKGLLTNESIINENYDLIFYNMNNKEILKEIIDNHNFSFSFDDINPKDLLLYIPIENIFELYPEQLSIKKKDKIRDEYRDGMKFLMSRGVIDIDFILNWDIPERIKKILGKLYVFALIDEDKISEEDIEQIIQEEDDKEVAAEIAAYYIEHYTIEQEIVQENININLPLPPKYSIVSDIAPYLENKSKQEQIETMMYFMQYIYIDEDQSWEWIMNKNIDFGDNADEWYPLNMWEDVMNDNDDKGIYPNASITFDYDFDEESYRIVIINYDEIDNYHISDSEMARFLDLVFDSLF